MPEKCSAVDKMERAFFELIKRKHYSRIPVSELIEKAGVSRTTFYRHYEDINDMYKKVCRHMLSEIIYHLGQALAHKDSETDSIIELFCQKLSGQREYIKLLSCENGGRYFFDAGYCMIIDYANELKNAFSEEELFVFKLVVCSGISTYIWALAGDEDYFPEYLSICKKMLIEARVIEE